MGGQYSFLVFPAWQTSTCDSGHVCLLLQFRRESLSLPLLLVADACTTWFAITTIRGALSITNVNNGVSHDDEIKWNGISTDFLVGALTLGGRGSGASLSPELLPGVLKPTDEPEVSAHVYCPPELE